MNISIKLHPDALYDAVYEEHTLDTDSFTRAPRGFSAPQTSQAEANLASAGGGYVNVTACSDKILRIRVSMKGSAPEQSLTESLGLLKVGLPSGALSC
ncbi:MAG: hypothetical protein JXR97_09175, partial [Planctomycetes bacterium]|nr:hypothetical protein [Planctomycetota bacterium]